MKQKKISIRFTVGGMFLIATILTAIVAVSLQYYFSKKMATEHTLSKLTMASEELSGYVGKLDSDAENTAKLLASVSRSIEGKLSKKEVRSILSEAVKDNPLFYSIYIGSDNDDFFQVINLESSPIVREKIVAADTDRWVVIDIRGDKNNRIRSTQYYDENFVLRDNVVTESNYFPTSRPWFTSATENEVEKTKPYLFQHLKITGQTYSLVVEGHESNPARHVIGIDIVLSSVANKMSATALGLKTDSSVESFLFSKTGNLIASNRKPVDTSQLPQVSPLTLTSDQREAVTKAKSLLISNQNDWAPMDFAVSGRPQGYSVDLLTLVESMTGIHFEFVNGFTWGELVNKYKNESLDGLHSLQKWEGNDIQGSYSDYLFDIPFSVVTRKGQATINNYYELNGKKIALLAGWSIYQKLQNDFPNVELEEFSNMEDALASVAKGETFAMLDSKSVLASSLDRYFFTELQLHEPLQDLKKLYPTKFYMVLQPHHGDLIPIINLALKNITVEQKAFLKEKWLNNRLSRQDTMVPYSELFELSHNDQLQGQMIQREIDGEIKYLYVKPIATGGESQEYFAVVIDRREIFSAVTKRLNTSIGVTLLLMCLTLPVAWIFGAPIVRPIKQLRLETEKIKNRDYDNVLLVNTSIKEVWELSQAIQEMSHELHQYEESQEAFVEAFIKLIAQAIDDKSPYTAGHCNRVPELGMMLAEAAEKCDSGQFKSFKFENDDERREFRIAAWLHDCGKITTPEHIVDKGTKLEANYNRIHEVRTRFEVLWRDAEICALKRQIAGEEHSEIESDLKHEQNNLTRDFEFIARSNVGGEFMSEDKVKRILDIAEKTWQRNFDNRLGLSPVEELNVSKEQPSLPATEKLLANKPEHIIKRDRPLEFDPKHGIKMDVPDHLYDMGEVYNLSVARGTLTAEDRFKINEHMISTIKMLENLPFPQELSRVPRYASTHHETLKGTGYPRKLSAEDLSIPERILVISDIFEALTAADRPYKKAKPISVAVDIMHKMALDEHLDIELFKLFLTSGTHIRYAEEYLKPEQIDHVDVSKYIVEQEQVA